MAQTARIIRRHLHIPICDGAPSHASWCEGPACPVVLRDDGRWYATDVPEHEGPCSACEEEYGYCGGCQRWYPYTDTYPVRVRQEYGIDRGTQRCEACLQGDEVVGLAGGRRPMVDQRGDREQCAPGQVQVKFVGCPPEARRGLYGWAPTRSASLELYVDGVRFSLELGDLPEGGRGLHIITSPMITIERTAINSVSLQIQE